MTSVYEIFQTSSPIELELGMGRAHFLFDRAKAVPHHHIIGIEWKAQWVKQADKKKAREEIKNVWPIHANAWLWVPHIPDNSLSAVIVNFPDPWWKKRHHKRRILNTHFLDTLVNKMQPEGRIFIQTDVLNLFEIYKDLLDFHPLLQLKAEGEEVQNLLEAQTHREKKCIEKCINIYRLAYSKTR